MARIASIGAALQEVYLIDHDDLGPSRFLEGSKVDIDNLYYGVDGGGINSAVTFARFGHETVLLSNVARDTAGEAIVSVLDKEEIDSSYINIVSKKSTGTAVVLLDSKSKERKILTYHGASGSYSNFSEKDLDLIQPDWLYASSLNGDMETLLRFFEKAHEIGAKVMFNPGEKELDEAQKLVGLLSDVDVLIVNKREAARIVPGTVLVELLCHLNNYVPMAIITDGPMGGIAGDRSRSDYYRFGIYEDIKVRDITGAGDAFASGFLAAYAGGKSFRSSLVFASANATEIIKTVGASDKILSRDAELHMMPIQKMQV